MTASQPPYGQRLSFADAGEAADLVAFLARLIHYDRAAAVRLQADGGVLAVFGRPPSFEVLAIRTARLAGGAGETVFDTTVSAGQLADALDTATPSADGGLEITVPDAVTGPPWAGVLPPRGGWQRVAGLPDVAAVRGAVAAAVAEFRARDEALPEQHRTRGERDRIGREIWSRTLGETGLPLRAVHAAQALGFLRPLPAGAVVRQLARVGGGVGPAPEPLTLFAAGGWLRLRTPYGSVVVRVGGVTGLTVTPA
ncbi:hypothetical protein AF335_03330 [Streptomyces eurocidicus]|uniref:Uncharacterized protein n=1 Tax=Streptomyces eurocidicus TaxID=66423 RepID=A0A2N8P2Z9_STREU|nr:hypothetical protein [Streptomyces eurocidicus]MBB5117556.1 hypothetical protein [Streptomyces eurocidicus]MBF6053397.1 hypothetical protein [Streptomyces eurocidicus]PNE35388.1 hypothetical protein AF335_03330 [Streptomyces eurocidicus]